MCEVYYSVKKYVTLLGKREIEFIKRLQNNEEVRQLYKPPDIRQLKYRLLYKRKVLTNDLITLNAILDKLQSL
jgi:serine kinase of HPr protein (carbohydrate metabolism regulator)